jgi:uncharacterized protein involved in exopolysaccharide biosynthesis
MSLEEILTYWRIVWKRVPLIALLVLVTVGTIFLQQYTADRVYQASVRFQITAPPPSDVTLYKGFSAPKLREEIAFMRGNFANVITSGSVARQVIADLGLEGMKSNEITSNIEIEDIEGSDLTKVQVSAGDPQLVADIANAVMDVALQQYGQLRARSATMSRQFIAAESETTRQELQQAQDALIAFKIENRIGSLDGMISEQQELLSGLRSRRDDAWATGSQDKAHNFDQLIAQREAELQDLVRLSAQYEILQADVRQIRDTYDFLLTKQTEAKLTENETLTVGFIQVLGEASPPSRPVSPYNFKILALGGMVSLALGVVIAFVWEFIASATMSKEKRGDQEVQGTTTA